MILKIELENFFSVKDRVRVDFRAASINTARARELAYNVMQWNGTPVLKSVGIFGPNASGKSNILKAVAFCRWMILFSQNNTPSTPLNFQPFKFGGCPGRPSGFMACFVCDGVEYEYAFSLTHKGITAETLYHYPSGRRAKVFAREEDGTYSFGEGTVPKPADVVTNTGAKNLFLSRAATMGRGFAQRICHYFETQFLPGIANANDIAVRDIFNKHKTLILKALETCDSDITDIVARKERAAMPVLNADGGRMEFRIADVLRFKTAHRNQDGVTFDMDAEESGGTRKLFRILLRLIDVARNGKTVMMDEFDTGLHTRLADFILDLVHASGQGQLLFTSHNTNLIDVKRLRRDQILFVNKDEDGATNAYALYDFKDFRENMDAEKAYIQGRFDAVPYVGSSAEELRQILEG